MTVITPEQVRKYPSQVNGPVNTVVKVNCGCGFTSTDLVEGQAHAVTTGHTLHIFGEIRVPR